MKTVELFAGIGGFRMASDSAGLSTIWANDINPQSCAVYRSRFGAKELREGDIAELVSQIPSHDVLTAGFPCQPFSSAGKKEGIRDPRGTLFQHIVDVLKTKRPRHFVLENVKRLLTMENGLHFATILSSLAELDYKIEWRLLNAMHFGLPQNRQRVFIIGTRADVNGHNDPPRVRLASDEELATGQLGSMTDVALWKRIGQHGRRFASWGLAMNGHFTAADLDMFSESTPLARVSTVLQDSVSAQFDFTESTLQWLPKNTPVNKLVQGVEILSNQAGGARMGYTIFGINGVAPTLTSTTSRHYERYKIGASYRRLTNVEYARIQGFPDEHCGICSIYDQYALFGNAVPPPMASWVMRRMISEGTCLCDLVNINEQRILFDYASQS